jgi:choloylglycine hydrolase
MPAGRAPGAARLGGRWAAVPADMDYTERNRLTYRRSAMLKAFTLSIAALMLLCLLPIDLTACSTFKFQKGGELIYGHNLDQPERDMPGMIFINKRGVFKTGRSFSEMFFDEARCEPTDLDWISRYGSVTFAIYGRDFPDGGINEAGIFIWEMGLVGTRYPESPKLPRLLKMNWVQYVLDNCGTLDEAVSAAYDIQLEGWQWHFFVGDSKGHCATIEFLDGEVVVHQGDDMPVPALFNQPYDRELEYMRLFKGFGGLYEPDFEARLDTRVPRMVKAAVMFRDFDADSQDALEYSKSLLWEVGNKPYKWGILIDVVRGSVHFNTEANREWKSFSYRDIDYSNSGPVMTLDIDQAKGGEVWSRFHPLNDGEFRTVFKGYVDDMSAGSLEYFGVKAEVLIERFATAYHRAELKERHYFAGVWEGQSRESDENGDKERFTLTLEADGASISGTVEFRGEACSLEHILVIDRKLEFSFMGRSGRVWFPKGYISGQSLDLQLKSIKGDEGSYILQRHQSM